MQDFFEDHIINGEIASMIPLNAMLLVAVDYSLWSPLSILLLRQLISPFIIWGRCF